MERRRIAFLDEVRGFAIICMVFYHVMFDLKYFHKIDVPLMFDSNGWFNIVRDVFAGTFIFISGCVCRFSRNNLKRGVQCFLIGMVITFVTAFASPDAPVYFGILHMLGISMILYDLSENFFNDFPAAPGFLAFAALFLIFFNVPRGYLGLENVFSIDLPRELYKAELLFPLGFQSKAFFTVDYFPLFPWFFLFAAGSFFGVYASRGALPKFFYKSHVPFFAATGKHTIWIYILHQPLAFVILNLIFKGRLF